MGNHIVHTGVHWKWRTVGCDCDLQVPYPDLSNVARAWQMANFNPTAWMRPRDDPDIGNYEWRNPTRRTLGLLVRRTDSDSK